MDNALLTTLRVHNPWLDRPAEQAALLRASLPRRFVPRVHRLELRPGRAELVVGPRQAGKSTLIRAALADQADPVLVLHAEEPRIRELSESPAVALDRLSGVLTPSTILVLEEIQNLPDASLFIKGIVDLDSKRRIVATGSSSFAFQARTRESLTGRARRILLLPFSLAEVAALEPKDLAPAVREARLLELWSRLLVHGGYPESWFETDPEITLRYLVEAFVLKDASDLHTIERPSAFRKLLELAAADIGNLVNLSEWAAVAQASRATAARYLDIAEQAHVLRLVPPFVGGRRAEVTSASKVYFLDNGLRNAVFGGFSPWAGRTDRGPLWENSTYCELIKRLQLLDEVRYWRSKNGAEVDFVVRRRDRLVAIEVKAGELPRPKLNRASRSFIAAYAPACFGVVNSRLREDSTAHGAPVLFRRPWEIDEILAPLDG